MPLVKLFLSILMSPLSISLKKLGYVREKCVHTELLQLAEEQEKVWRTLASLEIERKEVEFIKSTYLISLFGGNEAKNIVRH